MLPKTLIPQNTKASFRFQSSQQLVVRRLFLEQVELPEHGGFWIAAGQGAAQHR